MNRLANMVNPAPRNDKIRRILDHLDNQSPDEAATLRAWLSAPADEYGHQFITDSANAIAAEDGLNLTISEETIRRYRKKLA